MFSLAPQTKALETVDHMLKYGSCWIPSCALTTANHNKKIMQISKKRSLWDLAGPDSAGTCLLGALGKSLALFNTSNGTLYTTIPVGIFLTHWPEDIGVSPYSANLDTITAFKRYSVQQKPVCTNSAVWTIKIALDPLLGSNPMLFSKHVDHEGWGRGLEIYRCTQTILEAWQGRGGPSLCFHCEICTRNVETTKQILEYVTSSQGKTKLIEVGE